MWVDRFARPALGAVAAGRWAITRASSTRLPRPASPRARLAAYGAIAAVALTPAPAAAAIAASPSAPAIAAVAAHPLYATGPPPTDAGKTTAIVHALRKAAHLAHVRHVRHVRQLRRQAARRAARRAAIAAAAQQQSPPPPPASGGGDPRAYARSLVGAAQFACVDAIFTRESGWNPTATNPASGAYGIPQALPGAKMASAGPDWQTNPDTQVRWGVQYMIASYGSPCGAWAFWQEHGSY